jgi:hypothetical protein
MTIWTFKRVALAFALLFVSACDVPSADKDNVYKAATLMGGALFVEPPAGYCVDRASLRNNFALMARCDTLGGETDGSVPLGVLTVSAAPMPDGFSIKEALPGIIRTGETYMRAVSSGSFQAVQVKGKTPAGTDARHWRGLVSTGEYLLQISAFGPKESAMAGQSGAQTLARLSRQVAEVNRQHP